jgi:hypothetical protein
MFKFLEAREFNGMISLAAEGDSAALQDLMEAMASELNIDLKEIGYGGYIKKEG